MLGRIIDPLAVFALIAGTATTFSIATPLMASIINELFHIELSRTVVTIIIILITCVIYTYSLLHGFKGISFSCESLTRIPVLRIAFVCITFEEKQNSLLKMVLHLLEKWFKISLSFQHLQTRKEQHHSTELYNLLLGILDGMVCGSSVLYWKHFQRKNSSSDHSWRICIWCWINNCKLHCSWKLFSWKTD